MSPTLSLRRIIAYCLLALLLLASTANSADLVPSRGPFLADLVQARTFSSGFTCVVDPLDCTGVVALTWTLQAGSAADPADAPGLANLVAHLEHSRLQQLLRQADPASGLLGARLDLDVSRDFVNFTLRCSPLFWRPALLAFTRALFSEAPVQADFAQVRATLEGQLKRDADDPARLLDNALYKRAFGTHPYAHPVAGTLDALQKLDFTAAKRFWRTNYVGARSALCLSGPLPPSDVFDFCKQSLSPLLHHGKPAPRLPSKLEKRVSGLEKLPGTGSRALCSIAFYAPALSDPEGVLACDTVLFALNSRGPAGLLHALKDLSPLRLPTASFLTRQGPGLLVLTFEVPDDKLDQALDAVSLCCKALASPAADSTLLAARDEALADYIATTSTPLERATGLAFYQSKIGWRFAVDYFDRLAALDLSRLSARAGSLLDWQKAVIEVLYHD